MRALALGFLFMVIVGLVGSCSATGAGPGETPTTLAFAASKSTLIAGPPDVVFSGTDVDLIIFQSAWVCEFQRRTFSDQDAGDAALAEALEGAEITLESYEDFLLRMSEDQALRDAVLYRYQESCRG